MNKAIELSEQETMTPGEAHLPGNQSPCHSKAVPLWLVLLDNLPTLALFLLGAVIIGFISYIWAVIFLGYALASVVVFRARICPYCHHYATRACPCGFLLIPLVSGLVGCKNCTIREDCPWMLSLKRGNDNKTK